MHLHLFPPPPPLHLMPFLLTAALAFAAGVFLTRRGVPSRHRRIRRQARPALGVLAAIV